MLRSQTSPMQVRAMDTMPLPIRIIAPGRVYRNETTDARHERAFFQYEASSWTRTSPSPPAR